MQVAENPTDNGLSKRRTHWLKSPEVSLALRGTESRGSSPLPPQDPAPLLVQTCVLLSGFTHGGFPWGGPHSSQLSSFRKEEFLFAVGPTHVAN